MTDTPPVPKEDLPEAAEVPRSPWGPRLVAAAIVVIMGLGITSTIGQVLQLQNDKANERTEQVASCRSELRSIYLDQPSANVTAVNTTLDIINAAGLEAAVDGKNGKSADAARSPFSGLTLAQLRTASASTREALYAAKLYATKQAKVHSRLVDLSGDDTGKYLSECERLTK